MEGPKKSCSEEAYNGTKTPTPPKGFWAKEGASRKMEKNVKAQPARCGGRRRKKNPQEEFVPLHIKGGGERDAEFDKKLSGNRLTTGGAADRGKGLKWPISEGSRNCRRKKKEKKEFKGKGIAVLGERTQKGHPRKALEPINAFSRGGGGGSAGGKVSFGRTQVVRRRRPSFLSKLLPPRGNARIPKKMSRVMILGERTDRRRMFDQDTRLLWGKRRGGYGTKKRKKSTKLYKLSPEKSALLLKGKP